jgi:hypothetical protein
MLACNKEEMGAGRWEQQTGEFFKMPCLVFAPILSFKER